MRVGCLLPTRFGCIARLINDVSERACDLERRPGAFETTAHHKDSKKGHSFFIKLRGSGLRYLAAAQKESQQPPVLQASPSASSTALDMSDLLGNPRPCKKCGAHGCEIQCPCKQGYYCSFKCQMDDWAEHKMECAVQLAKKVKDAKQEHGKNSVQAAKARLRAAGGAILNRVKARRNLIVAQGAGRYDVGAACHSLGTKYLQAGRIDEGMGLLEKALEVYRNTMGERSPDAGECLTDIGAAPYDQGQLEEALAKLEEALGMCIY